MTSKVRVGIMSDLHVEFDKGLLERAQAAAASGRMSSSALSWWSHLKERRGQFPSHPWLGPDLHSLVGADLILVAGDTAVGAEMTAEWLTAASRYCHCPVVAVLGNHEFYDGIDIGRTTAEIMASCDGVHVLENGRVSLTLQGREIAVLGTTLWSDYALNGHDLQSIGRAMGDAGRLLNDHGLIRHGVNAFRPAHALEMHTRARRWLSTAIPTAKDEAETVVVMTHHAPSGLANPPQYRGGDLSPAFATDMEAEIAEWNPDYWLSGHTHWNHDFIVGGTRCLSRQRGYVGSEPEPGMPSAEDFEPLILEI